MFQHHLAEWLLSEHSFRSLAKVVVIDRIEGWSRCDIVGMPCLSNDLRLALSLSHLCRTKHARRNRNCSSNSRRKEGKEQYETSRWRRWWAGLLQAEPWRLQDCHSPVNYRWLGGVEGVSVLWMKVNEASIPGVNVFSRKDLGLFCPLRLDFEP